MCALLLCGIVLWTTMSLPPKQFSGYIMQSSRGTNALRARIASHRYGAFLAPLTRPFLADECSIEVWQEMGRWDKPIMQLDVSEAEYRRCVPGTYVTVVYRERRDGSFEVIEIRERT